MNMNQLLGRRYKALIDIAKLFDNATFANQTPLTDKIVQILLKEKCLIVDHSERIPKLKVAE